MASRPMIAPVESPPRRRRPCLPLSPEHAAILVGLIAAMPPATTHAAIARAFASRTGWTISPEAVRVRRGGMPESPGPRRTGLGRRPGRPARRAAALRRLVAWAAREAAKKTVEGRVAIEAEARREEAGRLAALGRRRGD